jgi:hypothetical protein
MPSALVGRDRCTQRRAAAPQPLGHVERASGPVSCCSCRATQQLHYGMAVEVEAVIEIEG